MKIGYARVSSEDQNEERQIVKFREIGIEDRFIFIDKVSGNTFNRPDYKRMIATIRDGDLIYIDALDRLGRNYDGIISEWKHITRELGADIVVLENEELFDSRKYKSMGDIGKLLEDQFLSLLSYAADQERQKIRKRQAEGIKIAKSKNVHMGRPRLELSEDFHGIYYKWKEGKLKAVDAMRILKFKKSTFYKKVKEYEAKI